MADDFAQYQNEEPILREQQVQSGAEGMEVLGQGLSQVARAAASEAGDQANAESVANYYLGRGQAQKIHNDMHINILTDPGNAAQYIATANKSFDDLKASTPLNASHKEEFNYSIDSLKNNLQLQAAEQLNKVNKTSAQYMFLGQMHEQLKGLQESAGNPKNFDAISTNLQDMVNLGLANGMLTASEAVTATKQIHNVHDNVASLYQHITAGDINAKEHDQRTRSMVGAVNTLGDPNAPVADYTAQKDKQLNDDQSMKGLYSALANNTWTPSQSIAYGKLTPEERNKVDTYMAGSHEAWSYLKTNNAWEILQNESTRLNSKSGPLTENEEGRKAALNSIFTKVDQGGFLQIMRQTNAGAQIESNYAIERDANINASPDVKNEIYNRYVTQMTLKAHAMGMPMSLVKPIAQQYVTAAQSAFDANGDPHKLINMERLHTKENAQQLANEMKMPVQQAVASIVGSLSTDPRHDEFAANLIKYNQKGVDFGALNTKDSTNNDRTLRNELIANDDSGLHSVIRNESSDQNRLDSFYKAGINYIKGEAQANGDFTLNNKTQYAKDYLTHVSAGYDIKSGFNFAFNNARLNLTDSQISSLVQNQIGAQHERWEAMCTDPKTNKLDAFAYQRLVDSKPLIVTNDPNGFIKIMSDTGELIHEEPFSSHLYQESKKYSNKSEAEYYEQASNDLKRNLND